MRVIAIIAGEASGDVLAAGLIKEYKKMDPTTHFIGVAGPLMVEQGCEAIVPISELSVMGLVEILRHLPRLLRLRKQLVKRILAIKPDCFIGVDFPGFNLSIETILRQQGIRTVHYVSPSIWAWRKNRINKIKKAVDLLLAILPFEPRLYHELKIDCRFIGHPVADDMPLLPDKIKARSALKIDPTLNVIALLPGSRKSEITQHIDIMLNAAQIMSQQHSKLLFVVPCATCDIRSMVKKKLSAHHANINCLLVIENARQVLICANAAVIASGTATLEALMAKVPMVVVYRTARLSYFIWRTLGLLKLKRVSLPNILADRELVPELLQQDMTAENIALKVSEQLLNGQSCRELTQAYHEIHKSLRKSADANAAKAVAFLVNNN